MSCRTSYNRVGREMESCTGTPPAAVARDGKPHGWPDRMVLITKDDGGVTVTDQWWNPDEADWQTQSARADEEAPVILRSGGRLVVRTPLKPAFRDALKRAVPWDGGQGREWDGKSKCWRVDPRYETQVRGLVEQHFGSLVDRTPREAIDDDGAARVGPEALTSTPSVERSRDVPADGWSLERMADWCRANGYFVHAFDGGARVFWEERPKGWPRRIDFVQADGFVVVTPMWRLEERDVAPEGGQQLQRPLDQMVTWCEENGYEVRRYPGGARAFWKEKWPVRRVAAIRRKRDKWNGRLRYERQQAGGELPAEYKRQVDFRYDM